MRLVEDQGAGLELGQLGGVDGQRADVIERRRLQRAHVTDDFLNVIDSKQLTEPTETARTLLLYLATVDVPRQPMIIGEKKLKKKSDEMLIIIFHSAFADSPKAS